MSRKWKAPYRPAAYGTAIASEVALMGKAKWAYFQKKRSTAARPRSAARKIRPLPARPPRNSEVDLMDLIGSNCPANHFPSVRNDANPDDCITVQSPFPTAHPEHRSPLTAVAPDVTRQHPSSFAMEGNLLPKISETIPRS